MTYEELMKSDDVSISEIDMSAVPSLKGLYYAGSIGIDKNLKTTKEKACVLAEELGHYHTSSGDILDQSNVANRKQELRARIWGYNKMIGLTGLISAVKANCRNVYEIAEYLDVTEDYLKEALAAYRSKYGLSKAVDNYWITFEPNLQIYEIFPLDQ